MIYGYARVSTLGQASHGNSIEDQREKLLAAGCDVIYTDNYTGTTIDRPQLSVLLGRLTSGDRLVVTKLDRFARTAADGIKAIRSLLDRGISVHILNMGLIDNTPTGKLMVTMLLGFAEFERDMIVERTMAGKAVARATRPGYKEGRPALKIDQAELRDLMEKQRRGDLSVGECCERLGISRSSWYNLIRSAA